MVYGEGVNRQFQVERNLFRVETYVSARHQFQFQKAQTKVMKTFVKSVFMSFKVLDEFQA